MIRLSRHLNLQAKISLVLAAVILPTFVIVTIAENKFTLPVMEEEIRQIGINSGKTLAAQIVSSRMLSHPNAVSIIENAIQEIVYTQPDIVRMEVFAKDPQTGSVKLVASNVDEEPAPPGPSSSLVDSVTSEYRVSEGGSGLWEIYVPIELRSRDPRGPRRLVGTVHVVVSTILVSRIVSALWKTTATAAAFSVVSLILVLSYFLRKTIENDRLLKIAQTANLQLTEQLLDAERKITTNEKLAVMGQLTASFAHEIGTPLNAIGGHLQLLKEEILPVVGKETEERLEIVNGQLTKIEEIVKGFLHSTEKPTLQKQLVDLNVLAEKTLEILYPRIESLDIKVKRRFDREIRPVRVVPLDLEQILLNLLNNSLDSIKSKLKKRDKGEFQLELRTAVILNKGREWAEVSVYDTGEGISKVDLKKVLKPFFTTKRPGEGTGLGLTICQQVAHKYGGELVIDSKQGSWTRVKVRLPYQVNT